MITSSKTKARNQLEISVFKIL